MMSTKFKDAVALLDEQIIKPMIDAKLVKQNIENGNADHATAEYKKQVVALIQSASKSKSWPAVVEEIATTFYNEAMAHHLITNLVETHLITTETIGLSIDLRQREKNKIRKNARKAAEAVHSQVGGSRDKRARIRAIWESGKYQTKTKCAEMEHEKIGMSFPTALKALGDPKKK